MWRLPRKKLPSFLKIFLMSRPLVRLGARVAMELSQTTLLVLASSIITWLLLVGVSDQSLAKQIMFWPIILLGAETAGALARALGRGRELTTTLASILSSDYRAYFRRGFHPSP